jgi:hypothetical protein
MAHSDVNKNGVCQSLFAFEVKGKKLKVKSQKLFTFHPSVFLRTCFSLFTFATLLKLALHQTPISANLSLEARYV